MPNEPLDLDAIEARAEDDLPAATGDWRDLRYAITQADLTFMQRPKVERDYLWGFAERVIDRFPGLRARCAGCHRQFVWQQVYRCFDCSAPLCKDCIKSHSVGELEQEIAKLRELCVGYEKVCRALTSADEANALMATLFPEHQQ